jgi:3-oxoacyl-[acyl-carrier protein] reductase
MKLEPRTILVTGAAGAIGKAITKLLIDEGAWVAAVDLKPDTVSTHDRLLQLSADVTDTSSTDRAVAEALRWNGPFAGSVLCAGILETAPLCDLSPDVWFRTRTVNLDAALMSARAIAPAIADLGSLVFLSSIAAHKGSANHAAYAATKAGVIGLMRSLAWELGPRLRVNAVSPSAIRSPMIAPLMAERGDALAEITHLKRLGETAEVAGAVAFLLSSWSSYVTGQVIHVNGGAYIGG